MFITFAKPVCVNEACSLDNVTLLYFEASRWLGRKAVTAQPWRVDSVTVGWNMLLLNKSSECINTTIKCTNHTSIHFFYCKIILQGKHKLVRLLYINYTIRLFDFKWVLRSLKLWKLTKSFRYLQLTIIISCMSDFCFQIYSDSTEPSITNDKYTVIVMI